MRLFRPCFAAGWLYPEALFRLKTDKKLLCLTFDDGPDPATTIDLIDLLDQYNIKSLFFCNGQAAEKYPELMTLIISKGHMVGNHGYAHLDGLKTSLGKYVDNVSKADTLTSPLLFRPPYGRMRIGHYRRLKKKYKIILWDIMSYDFDKNFGNEKSLQVLKQKLRPGSIIVLHDNASSSCLKILSGFLDFTNENGYKFVVPDLQRISQRNTKARIG